MPYRKGIKKYVKRFVRKAFKKRYAAKKARKHARISRKIHRTKTLKGFKFYRKRGSELKWVDKSYAPFYIPGLTANAAVKQVDPSQFTLTQGVGISQFKDNQIKTINLEIWFDIYINDITTVFGSVPAIKDILRQARISCVEASSGVNIITNTPNITANGIYAPWDISKVKVLTDEQYTWNSATAPAATATISDQFPQAANFMRKKFHYKIPFKGTLDMINTGGSNFAPVVEKLIYFTFMSDMSNTVALGNALYVDNFLVRLWYIDD